MQPFVRIRRHRFRSSFLYLRRGGISNLRRGARWLPPSQSCTHMHITSSCAKSRWYLSLVAYLMFSSASPTSTTSPLPLMPHLPSASLLVAQIPRLRMHRPAQRAACIALSGELHALSGEPVLSLSRKETREPCGEEPSCRGDHAMASRRGERGGGDGALSAGEREGGWDGTEHCEYWGSAPALSAADAESGERSPQGVI